MRISRQLKIYSALVLSVLVLSGAYLLGWQLARQAAQDASERQLQVISLDLASILERYETLPFALSYQTTAAQALADPTSTESIDGLNTLLQQVQTQAKVAAIYLMDPTGRTIASSNWDTEQSYIGKNFGFRPYFLAAMQGKAGRFYGIGSTTAVPGYFIAQPIYASGSHQNKGTPVGVIAVKIVLRDLADNWNRLSEPVALADRWGVIFLSNRPTWQYRSLTPLPLAVQQDIASTLQYTGHQISPMSGLPAEAQAGFGAPVVHPVGRLGWQLMTFPDQSLMRRSAARWSLMAALLLVIAGVSAWAGEQRRRRLEERRLARLALQQATDDLERQIALRTLELTAANQSIEVRYAKLKEAELLLRDTQNELIQAGKLTMLGQMAAGMTHELNQPLTAIRAFSDNARIFLERGQLDRATHNLTHISAASERMGAIISQMKEFARKSDAPLALVDLARSIRSAVHLLSHDFQRSQCALSIEVRDDVQVVGDALRIEQVLINLLRNALDAAESAIRKEVKVVLSQETDWAVIRIRDSGSGIPDTVVARLFEPFFTTKPPGKGLGLGLAISSSIVQAMNGRLTAQNSADAGAEFALRLPTSTS
jgi:two-component system, NtrC family, C4-dicarboxylate transport sensor histidine kinase DctB